MLCWIVRLLNVVSTEHNSSAQSYSNKGKHFLRLIITSLFLLPVGVAIFLVVKLNNWLTSCLYGCWRLTRKPTAVDQAFHSFLLTKIKLEKAVTDVFQLLWVRAAFKVSPESFQGEEPPRREGHLTMLVYYKLEAVPGTLALVRYEAINEFGIAIAEDQFHDTPDEFCRLQDDVPRALANGLDVYIVSPHEPETFEGISQFIAQCS